MYKALHKDGYTPFLVIPKHKLLIPVVFNPAPPPRGETLVFKENLVEI